MLPPIGIPATCNYYKAGALNWKYAPITASVFLISGYFGSKLTLHIPMIILRRGLAVILVLITLRLFLSKQTGYEFLYT